MNPHEAAYTALIQFRKVIEPLKHEKFKTQKHHIKPRSICPELIDDPENLVELTILEHVQAHRELMLWYKDLYGESDVRFQKMFFAYKLMTQVRGVTLTEEEAAFLIEQQGRVNSIKLTGKRRSQKTKDKIRRILNSPETQKKLSEASTRMHANPVYQEKASAGLRRAWKRNKKEWSARNKKIATDPIVSAKKSKSQIQYWESMTEDEYAAVCAKKKKECNTPEFRKTCSEAQRKRNKRPEVLRRKSEILKDRWKDPAIRK